jgi:multidrug efflux pump subunit AcrB
MTRLQDRYAGLLERLLKRPATRRLTVIAFVLALIAALGVFSGGSQIFLPDTDDGRVFFRISVDPGTVLDDMDRMVVDIERMIAAQPEVENQFTIVGGMIFGRTEREIANRSSISAQLKPLRERTVSTGEWVRRMEARIAALHLPGAEVRISSGGVRGLRIGRGDEAVSLRVQGPDLDTLIDIGNDLMRRLKDVPGLRNLVHSNSEVREELSVEIDRERAARVGVDPASIGRAVQVALDGMVVSDYISEDREYDIRLRLPPGSVDLQSLPSLVIGQSGAASQPVHLGDVADVKLIPSPTEILRDNQRRIVEISATLATGAALGEVNREIQARLAGMPMPPGYSVYDAGDIQALQAGRKLGGVLLGLALFLVFVVMAVQYESLRDPLVILLGVPFAAVGAAAGIALSGLPLSMPVWLGMIMLAGIVVNNAILLVEYVEQLRARGMAPVAALVEAGRLRLRPILMTSLTTIVSLLPLAAGIGEGAEMLQPLAVTLVAGLALSLLVTLILIPILHLALGPGRPAA